MLEDIVLIGGGGHCKAIIDIIEHGNLFVIKGIVDRKELIGTRILGYEIIGCDDDLSSLAQQYENFHITIGHVKSNLARVRIFQELIDLNVQIPAIVSASAHVSKHASIGAGSVIMHNCIINAAAIVKENSIINTAAVIEHDAVIGNHCHVSTGAFINGQSTIEDNCFIGSNSTVLQGISIAEKTLVAAGAVIIADTIQGGVYAGNPAVLKKKTI